MIERKERSASIEANLRENRPVTSRAELGIQHDWFQPPLRLGSMKHVLILLAVVLVVIWVVARVVLAVTSVGLHLLWVLAIILAIVWLIGRLKA